MSIFSNNLIRLRKQQGLVQEELAEKIGVAKITLARWETDKFTPSVAQLEMTAKALGVPPSELLDEKPPTERGNATLVGNGGLTALPVLNLNACAGNGLCAMDDDFEPHDLVYLPELYSFDVKSHCCVRVNGTSMEPLLKNGDILVLCRAEYCHDLVRGQIAVVRYCGDYFIRCVASTCPQVVFAPMNPEYPSTTITDEPYELIGIAVGRVRYAQLERVM